MPPFLSNLAENGPMFSVLAFVMWLNWFLINKSIEKDQKARDADTKLIKELTEAVVQSTRENSAFNALHNERSMAFQKQVAEAHQAMMSEFSSVMQILCVQNKSIDKFDFVVDEIRGKINKLCEKA